MMLRYCISVDVFRCAVINVMSLSFSLSFIDHREDGRLIFYLVRLDSRLRGNDDGL